ncbi:MAG TPA: hypothetical protein VIV60_20270, partial [Polyangiaceae bacterium]
MILQRRATAALSLALLGLGASSCTLSEDDDGAVASVNGGNSGRSNNCHCSRGADGKFVCDCAGITFSNGEATVTDSGSVPIGGTGSGTNATSTNAGPTSA